MSYLSLLKYVAPIAVGALSNVYSDSGQRSLSNNLSNIYKRKYVQNGVKRFKVRKSKKYWLQNKYGRFHFKK